MAGKERCEKMAAKAKKKRFPCNENRVGHTHPVTDLKTAPADRFLFWNIFRIQSGKCLIIFGLFSGRI